MITTPRQHRKTLSSGAASSSSWCDEIIFINETCARLSQLLARELRRFEIAFRAQLINSLADGENGEEDDEEEEESDDKGNTKALSYGGGDNVSGRGGDGDEERREVEEGTTIIMAAAHNAPPPSLPPSPQTIVFGRLGEQTILKEQKAEGEKGRRGDGGALTTQQSAKLPPRYTTNTNNSEKVTPIKAAATIVINGARPNAAEHFDNHNGNGDDGVVTTATLAANEAVEAEEQHSDANADDDDDDDEVKALQRALAHEVGMLEADLDSATTAMMPMIMEEEDAPPPHSPSSSSHSFSALRNAVVRMVPRDTWAVFGSGRYGCGDANDDDDDADYNDDEMLLRLDANCRRGTAVGPPSSFSGKGGLKSKNATANQHASTHISGRGVRSPFATTTKAPPPKISVTTLPPSLPPPPPSLNSKKGLLPSSSAAADTSSITSKSKTHTDTNNSKGKIMASRGDKDAGRRNQREGGGEGGASPQFRAAATAALFTIQQQLQQRLLESLGAADPEQYLRDRAANPSNLGTLLWGSNATNNTNFNLSSPLSSSSSSGGGGGFFPLPPEILSLFSPSAAAEAAASGGGATAFVDSSSLKSSPLTTALVSGDGVPPSAAATAAAATSQVFRFPSFSEAASFLGPHLGNSSVNSGGGGGGGLFEAFAFANASVNNNNNASLSHRDNANNTNNAFVNLPHVPRQEEEEASNEHRSSGLFINPADLLPFFSFRERRDDVATLLDHSDSLLKHLRRKRLAMISTIVGSGGGGQVGGSKVGLSSPPAVSFPTSPPSLNSLAPSSSSSAVLSPPASHLPSAGEATAVLLSSSLSSPTAASAAAASSFHHQQRTAQLRGLKQWESLIADAEELAEQIAAETLEHEEVRAAMLRCANLERRRAEKALAAVDKKLRTMEPYCEFLSQQALTLLAEMNTAGFDHKKYEQQQKYTRPNEKKTQFVAKLNKKHADASEQATDEDLRLAYLSTLQVIRSLTIRDGIIRGELSFLWDLAKTSGHCEEVLGKIVRCQRCGEGLDGILGRRRLLAAEAAMAAEAAAAVNSSNEFAPNPKSKGNNGAGSRGRGGGGGFGAALRNPYDQSQWDHNTSNPNAAEGSSSSSSPNGMIEFYTLVPCGHDYCADCIRAIDKHYPEEGGPRQCRVCGELSLAPAVPNVQLTSLIQRMRFHESGARRVLEAAEQFKLAMGGGGGAMGEEWGE